jgi:hypothetical protein
MCIPKLIALGLIFVAVEIAVFIVIAVLLFVCKIPYLGPLLFVVVFPLSVVVAGITIVGSFLCMVLSLPAIWQGASITRALAQTFAIVRSRLLEAVLLLIFVGFLCFAVAMIIFGVLGFGLLPTLGMSMSIVGFGGFGMEAMMALSQGGGSAGHAIAGAIGGALLWAVAASLVGQVYLLGLSLVYLRVTEGLDLTASEEALRATFDDAKRRTVEFGEKARQATQRDGGGAAGAAAGGTMASGVAAAPAPVYNPPPAYSPPPGFAPAPAAGSGTAEESTTIASTRHDTPTVEPDIELPFDEPAPAPPAVPSYAAPPAWTPPPAKPAPSVAPLPAAAPLPAPTTCAQCLSPVSPEDVFCGVCGYRLK